MNEFGNEMKSIMEKYRQERDMREMKQYGKILTDEERQANFEKLKEAETRRFVDNSLRDGILKTTGTDVDKLLPPMSRFGGGREAKKQGVSARLMAFFERYIGLV